MLQNSSAPDAAADGTAAVDATLARRASGGDRAAFETIMRRHNRLVFRTARGIVSDDSEAQDVVQETYLRAFTSLHSFRGESVLSTWLVRIAINAALDAQRKRGRVVYMELGQDEILEQHPESTMSLRVPHKDLPEALAEGKQVRLILQAAIDRLPAIYRTVFMLRAVEEMSVEDVAYCLQVSDSVVKTRFLRARSMLREALGAEFQNQTSWVYQFAGARCEAVVNYVMAELASRSHGSLQ